MKRHFYRIQIVGFFHYPVIWQAQPKFRYDLKLPGYRSRIGILRSLQGWK